MEIQKLRQRPAGLILKSGGHSKPESGLCVMEAVSYVAGEDHSDSPKCACPVISSFLRTWNDSLPDADRQKLVEYIPQLIGTRASFEVEQTRGLVIADWYLRHFTPTWLELAGLSDHAEALRTANKVTKWLDVTAIQPKVSAAESAAWSAARSAARSAAWSATEQALAPTVARLQASAFELLNALISVKP